MIIDESNNHYSALPSGIQFSKYGHGNPEDPSAFTIFSSLKFNA